MRTMMKVQIDTEAGTRAIQSGSMAQLMERLLGQLQPEAAYFAPQDGVRTSFFVFDMEEPSQLVTLLEPVFSELKARVEVFPVMNQEDLQRGFQQLAPPTD